MARVVATGVLTEPVLVLNRNWVSIETCSVKSALKKVFAAKAKIVAPDMSVHDFETWVELIVGESEKAIRTARANIKLPEIIVLTGSKYERKHREVAFSRRNLMKRDRQTCQYCGAQPGPAKLTIDHVFPKAKGGRASWLNCVLACFECNLKKGDKTLEESGLKLRTRPFEPVWSPIFRVPHQKYKDSWKQFLPEKHFA